jgi:hypothetical protein
LEIFQGARRAEICPSLSAFRMFMVILQNYAVSKQKSCKIRKATPDKAKPKEENKALQLRPFN